MEIWKDLKLLFLKLYAVARKYLGVVVISDFSFIYVTVFKWIASRIGDNVIDFVNVNVKNRW